MNSRGVTEEAEIKTLHLEIYKRAYSDYLTGFPEEKRKVLNEIASNRLVSGKEVTIELYSPFQELCELKSACCGDPHRGRSRTFREKLEEWIRKPLSEEGSQSP